MGRSLNFKCNLIPLSLHIGGARLQGVARAVNNGRGSPAFCQAVILLQYRDCSPDILSNTSINIPQRIMVVQRVSKMLTSSDAFQQ